MKALKWIGLIFVLLILVFLSILLLIDPNDYRDDITAQAKEKAGINLAINGDLSWSLLPLGINLNNISILDQSQETFTKFSNLTLQIDTLSLLKLHPNIHALSLNGLDVQLLKDKDGKANWDNLLASTEEKPAASKNTEPEAKESSGKAISFLVEEVSISNAKVNYRDEQADQNVLVDNLQLKLNDIALNQAFPIALSFNVQSNLINNKTVVSELKSKLAINLEEERVSISDLSIQIANLLLRSNITVSQYTSQPTINADIELEPFALNDLLSQLGQKPIKTSNPDALRKIGLNSILSLKGNQLDITKLKLLLDQSSWEGTSSVDLSTQALALTFAGNSITIDDYLPPAQEGEAAPAPVQTSNKKAPADASLLPLETIRNLNLDIAFKQSALKAKDLDFRNIDLALTAKDGVITLEKANSLLFDGSITSQASINAKTDNVAWSSLLDVADVNLLEHIGGAELFGWHLGGSGDINLKAELKTQGNELSTLQEKAKGQIDLNIKEGAITGVNLNKLACEGFASLNREAITKSDWPNETQFNALEASVKINGNVIDSPKLIVENIGLRASGNGKVDLAQQSLAYYLDINPNGELGDPACRVRDKIKGIAIPLKCEGNFDTPPAQLCGLHTKKLGRIAEKLLKKEATRKVEKEIDRALDKKLNKYLDKDSELGKALKKGLKGLFQ